MHKGQVVHRRLAHANDAHDATPSNGVGCQNHTAFDSCAFEYRRGGRVLILAEPLSHGFCVFFRRQGGIDLVDKAPWAEIACKGQSFRLKIRDDDGMGALERSELGCTRKKREHTMENERAGRGKGKRNVTVASGIAYRCPRSGQCYQADGASTAYEGWSAQAETPRLDTVKDDAERLQQGGLSIGYVVREPAGKLGEQLTSRSCLELGICRRSPFVRTCKAILLDAPNTFAGSPRMGRRPQT